MSTTDVIDTLVGIAPGSPLDELRARRPESRTHAQGSYDALFAPADVSHASIPERAAIATFVASLHRQESAVAHYRARLEGEGDERIAATVLELAASAQELSPVGPYGNFTADNAPESVPGPSFDDFGRHFTERIPKASVSTGFIRVLDQLLWMLQILYY